jgi:hypothetical protein
MPQVNPSKGSNEQQRSPVECKAFRKNPDGSWESVLITDIQAPIGTIRIQPGTVFRKGGKLSGVDIFSMLEQNCSK